MPSPWVPEGGSGGDGKVFVDGTDSTSDFLSPKLIAGDNITLTVTNPGGYEQVEIDASGGVDTNTVLVDISDTVPGFLLDKIVGDDSINIGVVGSPSEQLSLSVNFPPPEPLQPLEKQFFVSPGFGAAVPTGAIDAPFEFIGDAIAAAIAGSYATLQVTMWSPSSGSEDLVLPDNFTFTLDGRDLENTIESLTLGNNCTVVIRNVLCQLGPLGPSVVVSSVGNTGILTWINDATENTGVVEDQILGIHAPGYTVNLTRIGLYGTSVVGAVSFTECGPHRFSGVGGITCLSLQAHDTDIGSGYLINVAGLAIFTSCRVSGSGPVITNPGAPIEVDSYTAKRFSDAGVTVSGGTKVVSAGGGGSSIGLYSARPSPGVSGRLYTCTDGATQYIEDGSTWFAVVDGRPSPQTPALAGWQQFGAITAVYFDSAGCIYGTDGIAGLDSLSGITLAKPATCVATAHVRYASLNDDYTAFGICLYDGTKVQTYWISTLSGEINFDVDYWDNVTTFNQNPTHSGAPIHEGVWLRLEDDGTTTTFSVSPDGINWAVYHSALSDIFMVATRIGVCGTAAGGYTALLDSWKLL